MTFRNPPTHTHTHRHTHTQVPPGASKTRLRHSSRGPSARPDRGCLRNSTRACIGFVEGLESTEAYKASYWLSACAKYKVFAIIYGSEIRLSTMKACKDSMAKELYKGSMGLWGLILL